VNYLSNIIVGLIIIFIEFINMLRTYNNPFHKYNFNKNYIPQNLPIYASPIYQIPINLSILISNKNNENNENKLMKIPFVNSLISKIYKTRNIKAFDDKNNLNILNTLNTLNTPNTSHDNYDNLIAYLENIINNEIILTYKQQQSLLTILLNINLENATLNQLTIIYDYAIKILDPMLLMYLFEVKKDLINSHYFLKFKINLRLSNIYIS
jgi:hypothetical protein